jgi:hypothetical protein
MRQAGQSSGVNAQHGDPSVSSRMISQKAAVCVVYAGAMFIAVMDGM